MIAVVEFKLTTSDPIDIEMSKNTELLNVYPTPTGPILIAQVNSESEETEIRRFYIRMSGTPLPEMGSDPVYIGSFHAVHQTDDGQSKPILFHVYEDTAPVIEEDKKV